MPSPGPRIMNTPPLPKPPSDPAPLTLAVMSAPSLPRPEHAAGRNRAVSAFLALWLMVLTAICLTGDIACVRGLIRQSEAARFHQTPGTVARIDRLPQTDRRGR